MALESAFSGKSPHTYFQTQISLFACLNNLNNFFSTKQLLFSCCDISIAKFVPLLAEMAKRYIDACISIEICSYSIQSLLVMKI